MVSNVLPSLQKLTTFKINGSIGSPGQKDKLSYTSLSYQITNGRDEGRTLKEITSAVIRAITPGTPLRTYLESRKKLSFSILFQILRSHFREKDSTSVFTELSGAVQEPQETVNDFVLRLMGMREKVLALAKEEDCPYDQRLVQKRFMYSLSTGMKSNNLRHSMQSILKIEDICDEDLLSAISQAEMKENEHSQKLSAKTKTLNAQVNEVTSHRDNLKEEVNILTSKLNELDSIVRHHCINRTDSHSPKSPPAQQTLKPYFPPPPIESRPHNQFRRPRRVNFQLPPQQTPNDRLRFSERLDNNLMPPSFPTSTMPYTPPVFQMSPSRNRQGNYIKPSSDLNSLRRRRSCENCHRSNAVFCDHCFVCGGIDHMAYQCNNRKQKQA